MADLPYFAFKQYSSGLRLLTTDGLGKFFEERAQEKLHDRVYYLRGEALGCQGEVLDTTVSLKH